MKFNIPIFDEPLLIQSSTVLVIKDAELFGSVVADFYNFEESKLQIFDNKFKNLKESELMTVTDILAYDVNSTSIIKSIYRDLENQFNEDLERKIELENLFIQINNLIQNEQLKFPLNLTSRELTFPKVFKALNIKIENNTQSLLDKMYDLIKLYTYLPEKRCLILINVGAYFTKEEITELINYINMLEIAVLFIEPSMIYTLPQYILDEDYILFPYNMV